MDCIPQVDGVHLDVSDYLNFFQQLLHGRSMDQKIQHFKLYIIISKHEISFKLALMTTAARIFDQKPGVIARLFIAKQMDSMIISGRVIFETKFPGG